MNSSHLAVVETDADRAAEIAAALAEQAYRLNGYHRATEAIRALRDGDRPALLILATDPDWKSRAELRGLAQELRIPVLEVLESVTDAKSAAERHRLSDGWVFRGNIAAELPVRVELMLRRNEPASENTRGGLPTDSRFFPLIVHDLRTPLNVIGLSLRMIDQALPRDNPDLDEDFRFVEENFKQIERMLAQLSDYCRLFEAEAPVQVAEFSPERLVSEVVASRPMKVGTKLAKVDVDVRSTCPAEASLDPLRARLAIQYALTNAVAASNGAGVRVILDGGPDRWVTEFLVEHPAPPTVKPINLRPHLFERLCGIAAERRGMDLAIAARISELFGGAARLDVGEDRASTIVLDWPARMPSA